MGVALIAASFLCLFVEEDTLLESRINVGKGIICTCIVLTTSTLTRSTGSFPQGSGRVYEHAGGAVDVS